MIETEELFDNSEQFRLQRLQVANWGTFSGIHDIEIANKGHLFVGGSGSGKSTLLDAMSVLLTPGHINFNAAAREGEKRSDRSVLSYIRGAWTTLQNEEGLATVRYLRDKSTWSAIALTYTSNLGRTVSLIFIGYVRGASTEESSVNKHYLILPADFSIADISEFAEANYDFRYIRKRFPQAENFTSFPPYCERMRTYFNIKEETVLKLLHKAQSAKNLGDINSFLRDYMLERPETFRLADGLVKEFGDLNTAYELVKKAREQVVILTQAKNAFSEKQVADKEHQKFEDQKAYIPHWHNYTSLKLVKTQIPSAEKTVQDFEGTQKELTVKISSLEDIIRDNELLLRSSGGEVLASLEKEKKYTLERLQETQRRADALKRPLEGLSCERPTNLRQWQELTRNLSEQKELSQEKRNQLAQNRDSLTIERAEQSKELRTLKREIDSMKAHPTNIPSELIELREEICNALSLTESDLPFAGELMQIRTGEEQWQGSCERVLSSFTRSMLVSEKNYSKLAHHVNSTHLGTKLLYNRVPTNEKETESPAEDSVPGKFDLRPGPWKRWMVRELRRRFDYVCVNSVEEFAHYEKAVTMAGQIKHNAVRHEKDDRHKINDRHNWFTGFSNTAKRIAFEKQAQSVADSIAKLSNKMTKLESELENLDSIHRAIELILRTEWNDIDANHFREILTEIERRYAEAKEKNKDLDVLAQKIRENKHSLEQLKAQERGAFQKLGAAKAQLEQLLSREQKLLSNLSGFQENIEYNKDFEKILRELHASNLTLEAMAETVVLLQSRISNVSVRAQNRANAALGRVTQEFSTFKLKWPTECTDLDASIESAPEFFEKLDQLNTDGLPKYEDRFHDLLENHAQQNLIDLGNEINEEARRIKKRLELVNESLAQVAFNRHTNNKVTHLKINISNRKLEPVAEFWKQRNTIVDNALEEDRETSERKFIYLRELVNKLDYNQPENRLWRERVLDVRQHVEFKGVEFDENGETVEVYNSGAGKSGGQRQKLTITCLAAALRYQLGGNKQTLPKYAPVILDEAFDKADSEFTDISMQIFREFGFQLIIATPEKGVFTLEPYVGATCYVQCKDRKYSSVIPIDYSEVSDSLVTDTAP